MEEKRNSTYLSLENQKRKVAEIVDIINGTGDSTLINQVSSIINSQNNKWDWCILKLGISIEL